MSDEKEKLEETPQGEESQGPLAGERLAEARREQQIPVIEIAKELHLDEYKVHALERNDFDVIGAPVFAKGHLRKYAQLVRVDEADVMADYYQLNRSVGAPPVFPTRPKPRQVMSLGPWIGVIVVIIVMVVVYWWFAARAVAPPPPADEIAALPQEIETMGEQQADITDEADDAPGDEPTDAPGDESTDEPGVSAEPEPVVEVVAAEEPPEMQLRITYSGDCWTEITDASGRRLYFALGKAGRTVNLSGDAPFNVLFGDAANVSLVVNGESFDIPAANRRGRTARMTITN